MCSRRTSLFHGNKSILHSVHFASFVPRWIATFEVWGAQPAKQRNCDVTYSTYQMYGRPFSGGAWPDHSKSASDGPGHLDYWQAGQLMEWCWKGWNCDLILGSLSHFWLSLACPFQLLQHNRQAHLIWHNACHPHRQPHKSLEKKCRLPQIPKDASTILSIDKLLPPLLLLYMYHVFDLEAASMSLENLTLLHLGHKLKVNVLMHLMG